MELIAVVAVLVLLAWIVRAQDQARRIAVLARPLGKYRIEKHMETLTQGYFRALGEEDAQRREQIWELLRPTEQALCAEFGRFVDAFGREAPAVARVCRLPVYVPYAAGLPLTSFDMRSALAIHARGIRRAIDVPPSVPQRERAFAIVAELLLMQHTCHWFCRSKLVASARLLARHKTPYDQVVGAVLPATRQDYLALTRAH
jgi:hypothetical protein